MNWSVEVLDRNNGRFLNSPDSCTPISLRWDDFSGPDKALIRCNCNQLGIEDWRARLGQDVRVYDPQCRLAWWGYLDQVSQRRGNLQHKVGMSNVANRVAIRFKDLAGSEPEAASQTAWVENSESQSVYGIKEAVYQTGYSFRSTAEWVAAVRLNENAWPRVELAPYTPGYEDESGAFYLDCRGWMHTLGWRIWPGLSAIISHSLSQQGIQPVGNSTATRRLAQSFLVNDSLQFNYLAVRARNQGNPLDSFQFSLQTDLNGKPSGVELGASLLSSSELSSATYNWVEVNLPEPVSLEAGSSYWLILDRSAGVDSSNYYLLGLDENQGYPLGSLLMYDQPSASWKSRSPGADLLFRLTGVLDQVEQMRGVIDHGGQFLKMFEAEFGQSLLLPPFSDEGQSCLHVFRALINQGNAAMEPLCSGIDPNRNLKVWKKPVESNAELRVNAQGGLETHFGQPLTAPWQAVGHWLVPETARPLYLSSLGLEPINACVSLNPG